MKSKKPGKRTSAPAVEIQGITPSGVWIYVLEREYLLSFADHPWFARATVEQIIDVELQHETHLHWPQLDVDLHVDSLAHPERFPLRSE